MQFVSHSGVLESEKEQGQNFVISLTLSIPRIKGCKTDDVRDTVDYSRVFSMVKDYVENLSCDLIEYMAHGIIVMLMRSFSSIEIIKCEIKKPTAPIDGVFESMNVVITRTRKQLEEEL